MAATCRPQTFTSNAHLVCYRRALFGYARLNVMDQNNRILAHQGKENAYLQKISVSAAINILALKAAAA